MNTFDQLKIMQHERKKDQTMTNENKWLKGIKKLVDSGSKNKAVKSEFLYEVTNYSIRKEKQYSPNEQKANAPIRTKRKCPFCGCDKILMGSFIIIYGQIFKYKYKCPKCQHHFNSLSAVNN